MADSSSITRTREGMPAVVEFPLPDGAETDGLKGCSTSGMDGAPQQRKLQMECGAGPNSAFNMDFARVLLNNAVGDGEPEAGTAPVAGLRCGLGGKERIVNPLQMFGGN